MELKVARIAALSFIFTVLIIHFTYTHRESDTNPASEITLLSPHHPPDSEPESQTPTPEPQIQQSSPKKPVTKEKRAYATYLSTRTDNNSSDDPYFTAVRVLAYQLLHQPSTRTELNIPLLVLVPPHVSDEKAHVLADEGATVIPVPILAAHTNWTTPKRVRFVDQFTKLRLWGLTDYDRILYLDADMLLTKSLDGIWDEPVIQQAADTNTSIRSTINEIKSHNHSAGGNATKSHEPVEPPGQLPQIDLPDTYLLAGVSDTGGANHSFPPPTGTTLNGGFFMLQPSQQWLDHYISILNTPYSFDSKFMEQSLLNFVHRPDGPAPWLRLPSGKWNVNWPSLADLQGGAATLHDKFWEEGNKSWIDTKLVDMWWSTQKRMEVFWQERTPREKIDMEGTKTDSGAERTVLPIEGKAGKSKARPVAEGGGNVV